MSRLSQPKGIDYYKDLAAGGEYKVELSKEEACIALKIHDYGVGSLDSDEKEILYTLIGKLKNQIWP